MGHTQQTNNNYIWASLQYSEVKLAVSKVSVSLKHLNTPTGKRSCHAILCDFTFDNIKATSSYLKQPLSICILMYVSLIYFKLDVDVYIDSDSRRFLGSVTHCCQT